jgi:hypothetical protein
MKPPEAVALEVPEDEMLAAPQFVVVLAVQKLGGVGTGTI